MTASLLEDARIERLEKLLLEVRELLRQDRVPLQADRGQRVAELQVRVARFFKVPVGGLLARGRAGVFVWPRHVAMRLAEELLGLNHSEAGRFFHRHPGAIRHGCRAVAAAAETDPKRRAEIDLLRGELTKLFYPDD